MAILTGVANTRAASPRSTLLQQQAQFGQRLHRCLRRAQFHVSTSHGVKHSSCDHDHDHDAWSHLDVNHLAIGALLTEFAPDATPEQRVSALEDFDFLPDMGRMTR